MDLPSWNELCVFHQENFHDDEAKKEICNIKNHPPAKTISFIRTFLKLNSKDPAWGRVKGFDWEEAVDIICDTSLRNQFFYQSHPTLENPVSFFSNRQFSQLPCTQTTTQKRVEKIKEFCNFDDPILLVGDDDFMGIFLSRAGFKDITSLDIDPVVCYTIKSIAEKENLPIKVLHHNIATTKIPSEWIKPYRLVMLDPMYSLDGVKMFLEGALPFIEKNTQSPCVFFLNLHLLSLMKFGLNQFNDLLKSLNLSLLSFEQEFNRYPVPKKTDMMISFFNRNFMPSLVMRSNKGYLGHFLSDALFLSYAPCPSMAVSPRTSPCPSMAVSGGPASS